MSFIAEFMDWLRYMVVSLPEPIFNVVIVMLVCYLFWLIWWLYQQTR
jgi:hypothetical protein